MNISTWTRKPLQWGMAAMAVAMLCIGAASASDDEQVLVVNMGGSPAEPFANGTATYRVRPDQTKLEVEVEDLRDTEAIEVFVDGASIGSASVVLGNAQVEVESETQVVPVLTASSEVIVTNLANGATVSASSNVVIDDDDSEGDDNGSEGEGDDEGNDDNGGEGEGDDEGVDDNGSDDEGEGDDEGSDDNGSDDEGEGDDEGSDDNGSDDEGEGDDEGSDDNGSDDEGEGDDEGDDDNGSDDEGEGDDEGDDDNGSDDEGEGDDEGDDDNGSDDEGEGDDDSGEVELEFVLTGTSNDPNAYGKAELKNDNELRRIEVEVQGVTAATRISVIVDGVNVGTGRVREGEAEVERDERQDYTIPVVTNASRVDVVDSDTGAILLSNKEVVITPEGETEGNGSEGEGEGSSEGEPNNTNGIQLTQKLGPNGYYVPGETTIIEARMTYAGGDPILALSIEQTLPEGWTYVGTVDNMGAFLNPRVGDTGTLTWAWIAVPQMPAVLRFEVFVPATATGVQSVSGNVVYRRMGGAEYAVAKLDAPAGEGYTKEYCHATDANRSWTVELTEVLRMIQLYNVGAYHCADGTEDGYAPGTGDDTCIPHDADHLSTDWSVDISELLRTVQFYNAEDSAYQVGDGTEDGFKPGVFSLED